jgi:hypothetical protein
MLRATKRLPHSATKPSIAQGQGRVANIVFVVALDTALAIRPRKCVPTTADKIELLLV